MSDPTNATMELPPRAHGLCVLGWCGAVHQGRAMLKEISFVVLQEGQWNGRMVSGLACSDCLASLWVRRVIKLKPAEREPPPKPGRQVTLATHGLTVKGDAIPPFEDLLSIAHGHGAHLGEFLVHGDDLEDLSKAFTKGASRLEDGQGGNVRIVKPTLGNYIDRRSMKIVPVRAVDYVPRGEARLVVWMEVPV